MAWTVEAAQVFGLCLLAGAPLCGLLSCGERTAPPASELRATAAHRRNVIAGCGFALFVIAVFADDGAGRDSLLRIALASAAFIALLASARSRSWSLPATLVAALAAGSQALASHAALEAGWLPLAGNAVHWAVAALWSGCVLHMLLQDAVSAVTARRFASLTLAALAMLALSGGLLGFVHVHNADALEASEYGATYTIKVACAAALLVVVTLLRPRIAAAPENNGAGVPAHSRLGRVCTAVVLCAVLGTSALLAEREPPGVAPFLNPQTWQLSGDGVALTVDVQPVAGRAGRARLELSADGIPDGALVRYSLYRVDGAAGEFDVEAVPVGPATFLGESVVAMPGEWRLEVMLDTANEQRKVLSHTVRLPDPPLLADLRSYLKVSTIAWSSDNAVAFAAGALLIIAACWLASLAASGRAPRPLLPAALLCVAYGGFLVLSVMYVKTYPSSFRDNPQPFTADVVRSGDTLYREHCARCHGMAGRGDGPWAVETRGTIPDLSSAHMDTHLDGEIYWWLSRGIPSLDMPAFADELSEKERWSLIVFLRSLRHAIPATQ